MICKTIPFGQVRVTSCVPTLPALRYLNCITMVGWHNCNSAYRTEYKDGIHELFVIYTVKGAGTLETEKGSFALCPDSLIFVPPHTPMKYFTDKQVGFWEFYWVDLTGERIPLWRRGCVGMGMVICGNCPPVSAFLRSF